MGLLGKFFQFREKDNPDAVKPFLDHLEDLRWTLIKMLCALVTGMAVALGFRHQLVWLIQKPLRDIDPGLVNSLQILGPFDSIILSFKLAFYAGIVLSFPFLLLFAAQFVLPALKSREKRLLFPAIAAGFFLFACGVAFSYFWVLPLTLEFCFSDARSLDLRLNMTATHYFSTVTHLTIALGLVFELPIVVIALHLMGIVSHKLMSNTRMYAWPGLLTLAAIIAPTPDPFTMLALGLPMCALYELCIAIVWVLESRKKRAKASAKEAA